MRVLFYFFFSENWTTYNFKCESNFESDVPDTVETPWEDSYLSSKVHPSVQDCEQYPLGKFCHYSISARDPRNDFTGNFAHLELCLFFFFYFLHGKQEK